MNSNLEKLILDTQSLKELSLTGSAIRKIHIKRKFELTYLSLIATEIDVKTAKAFIDYSTDRSTILLGGNPFKTSVFRRHYRNKKFHELQLFTNRDWNHLFQIAVSKASHFPSEIEKIALQTNPVNPNNKYCEGFIFQYIPEKINGDDFTFEKYSKIFNLSPKNEYKLKPSQWHMNLNSKKSGKGGWYALSKSVVYGIDHLDYQQQKRVIERMPGHFHAPRFLPTIVSIFNHYLKTNEKLYSRKISEGTYELTRCEEDGIFGRKILIGFNEGKPCVEGLSKAKKAGVGVAMTF